MRGGGSHSATNFVIRSNESDLLLVEPIELLVGGELGVEDQMLRWATMLVGPELDEAEDLLRLLALADTAGCRASRKRLTRKKWWPAGSGQVMGRLSNWLI